MSKNALFPSGCSLIIGASGGIGCKVAEVLALDGSDLALAYHNNPEPVEALVNSVQVDATCHKVDVTDPDSVSELIRNATAHHGTIHTLVWAAGPLVEQHLLAEISDAQWERAIAVEAHGFFRVVKALLPQRRKAGGGSLVHLGSAGHLRGPLRDGLSVVTKAANESLVKGIAREEGANGIRANSVLVGVIDAGMFRELSQKGAFPEGWEEETKKALALNRWGKPQEIGFAVSWLASNRASYVTGQQINVSGGFGI